MPYMWLKKLEEEEVWGRGLKGSSQPQRKESGGGVGGGGR